MNKSTTPHRQALARRLKRDAQRMAALLAESDDDFERLDEDTLDDLGLGAGAIGAAQAGWTGRGASAPAWL